MIAFEYCSHCNESVHWKCSICSKENEKSVHTHYTKREQLLGKVSGTAGAAMITFVSGVSGLVMFA
jgi:hypothetical protein